MKTKAVDYQPSTPIPTKLIGTNKYGIKVILYRVDRAGQRLWVTQSELDQPITHSTYISALTRYCGLLTFDFHEYNLLQHGKLDLRRK